MTVKELIELLKALPEQDQRIVLAGYEGGYKDIEGTNLSIRKLKLNVNSAWYYGPHDQVFYDTQEDCLAYELE